MFLHYRIQATNCKAPGCDLFVVNAQQFQRAHLAILLRSGAGLVVLNLLHYFGGCFQPLGQAGKRPIWSQPCPRLRGLSWSWPSSWRVAGRRKRIARRTRSETPSAQRAADGLAVELGFMHKGLDTVGRNADPQSCHILVTQKSLWSASWAGQSLD